MDTIEWLTKLVAFDTTSCNSNLPLIEYVADWLGIHKIPVQLTYDKTGTKANLFASIGSSTGGVVLSGHTDVVPVTGQVWDSDPFTATIRNDRIYGRGTCDMKGFLAVVLALVPEFKAQNRPVHLAFSYDEEVGCLGAPLLIEDFLKKGIRPSSCIVGEPTDMVPVIAHKGINSFRCKVHGQSAHSSLPNKGCNAIEHGAKLITWLKGLSDHFKEKGFKDGMYDVPYTTLNSTLVSGGIAINTIPPFLELLFEFRNLPQDDPSEIAKTIQSYIDQSLLPEMQKESHSAKVEFEPINAVPAFQSSNDIQDAKKVSYATEAGLFQTAGIPTVVCGPGSIKEAHKENEFVSLEQLKACENYLRRVISLDDH